MPDRPTYLGIVQDVQGATVSIALDKDTVSGLVFIDGQGYRIGQVGSFVRIELGFTNLFGIVSHVGAGAAPATLASADPHGYRWLRVQLVGESLRAGRFSRGVSQYPTIGDEAHLVTEEDLSRIYGAVEEPALVRLGSLASADSIPALIDIDRLVSRHCAVLGSTGTGKSTTVASLLSALSDPIRYPSARIVILDVHGEYKQALGHRAVVFRVNADESQGEQHLYIPYWALQLDELLAVTPFRGADDADRAAILQKIKELKTASLLACARPGVTPDSLTVDTPVPFSFHRLWYELYRQVLSTHTAQSVNQNSSTEALEHGPDGEPLRGDMMSVTPPKYRSITSGGENRVYLSASGLNIRRQLLATESLLRDSRYDFLFRPGDWCPNPTHSNPDAQPNLDLDAFLERWVGTQTPITILDLSGIPVSILVDLIGALLRLLFDALFWARRLPEGGRARPLLIVLEEAHAYLGSASKGAAVAAARRLVKEGRKYGLGAMIVSQRPAEIDQTILSQCGTTFAMRLSNSTDRSHVTSAAADNLGGLFEMLPALRTGEAIVVGDAVHLPLRAVVDAPAPGRRPDSHDPKVFDPSGASGWNRPAQAGDYARVVERWREESAKGEAHGGST